MVELREQIKRFGYSLSDVTESGEGLHCQVTGPVLQPIKALLRTDSKVCNLSALIGFLDLVPEASRYSLLVDFLELNAAHLFGRISMFRTKTNETDPAPVTALIIAETSFFWVDITAEKWNTRAKAVHNIAKAASALLASRGGIASINPFYEDLKDAMPAVGRIN